MHRVYTPMSAAAVEAATACHSASLFVYHLVFYVFMWWTECQLVIELRMSRDRAGGMHGGEGRPWWYPIKITLTLAFKLAMVIRAWASHSGMNCMLCVLWCSWKDVAVISCKSVTWKTTRITIWLFVLPVKHVSDQSLMQPLQMLYEPLTICECLW